MCPGEWFILEQKQQQCRLFASVYGDLVVWYSLPSPSPPYQTPWLICFAVTPSTSPGVPWGRDQEIWLRKLEREQAEFSALEILFHFIF